MIIIILKILSLPPWLGGTWHICTVHFGVLFTSKYAQYIFSGYPWKNVPYIFWGIHGTLKENVHVHFSGIRSSSLKMYMVHFEVQPKDFREHQGIRWNMENDGIKYYDNGKKDSCIDHHKPNISSPPPPCPRQSQTFPPPPSYEKGGGRGRKQM